MTISAILAMTALVAGLAVLCAILFVSLQKQPAMGWLGMALIVGVLESLALKDGTISALDLYLTAITIPLSYIGVGEAVRHAFGLRRSAPLYFALCAALVLATVLLLQLQVPPVVQMLPCQLAAALAQWRMVQCARQHRRRGDMLDLALLGALAGVMIVHVLRIPVFPILVGLESPFSQVPRQQLQNGLIMAFSILVPLVVFLIAARTVANALHAHRLRAEYDYMTQLPNRRTFEEIAGRKGQASGALVLCDIDNFKAVNDRFGHAAGDAVIRAFASLLDGSGMAARIGGEEFAIWLPDSSLEKALIHAERLRHEVTTLRLIEVIGEHQITASFGVASFARATPLAAALQQADAALYEAKNSGRNCVMVHRDEPVHRPRMTQHEWQAA